MHRLIGPAVLGLMVVGLAAHAHHSISGVYDTRQQAEIVGVITEFRFVQPHCFLILNAQPEANEPQLWRLEMDNHYELVQIGMSADTFKPGDEVIVSGFPARAESERLYVRQLDRPADGLRYEQVGFRPRISKLSEAPDS